MQAKLNLNVTKNELQSNIYIVVGKYFRVVIAPLIRCVYGLGKPNKTHSNRHKKWVRSGY